jgi:hypothetical protein
VFSPSLSQDSVMTQFLLEDDGKQYALKRPADDLFRKTVARKPENNIRMDLRLKDHQQRSAWIPSIR